MKKVTTAEDANGRPLEKGDTVTTLNGSTTGKISDLATEGDTTFVELRPVHQPYGPKVWHAAERVMWVAAAKKRKK